MNRSYGYIEFTKRLYPQVIPMIFKDQMACLYDKPLGVQIALMPAPGKHAISYAELEFGGNMIVIKLPNIINIYDTEQFDPRCQTDQIATDIVAALIHEAFHINQDIDLFRMQNDMIYKAYIENANMAASDRWMLNHIMQLNQIVCRIHPMNYGLNLSRVLYEYNTIAQYLENYHLKDMEQTISQKIKLIFPNDYMQYINSNSAQFTFLDGNPIFLKQNGCFDCNPVIDSLTNFNRLLYGITHGLPNLHGTINILNNDINCKFDIDWETVKLFSFNEF